jgi:hypothetical protein
LRLVFLLGDFGTALLALLLLALPLWDADLLPATPSSFNSSCFRRRRSASFSSLLSGFIADCSCGAKYSK